MEMNYTDIERAKYAPQTFDSDYLQDVFAELEEWRAVCKDSDDPQSVANYIDPLEQHQDSDEQRCDADLVERISFHHDPVVRELWAKILEIVEG